MDLGLLNLTVAYMPGSSARSAFLIWTITEAPVLLKGVDVRHDLCLFLEDLSRTVNQQVDQAREPVLTVEDARAIVAYHLRRNALAQTSHAKRWRKRHPGVNVEPLMSCFSTL